MGKLSNCEVTVLAGNGTAGYSGDNGPAESAQLNFPTGLAVDRAGNVFVVDHGNGVVRKIAGRTITTVGSGLSDAYGLAVDDHGNIYVAELPTGVLKFSERVVSVIARARSVSSDGPDQQGGGLV